MKFYKVIASLTILNILLSCGAGTLGGFQPITFPTSKAKLEQAVDSLFANYPQYRIPGKWQNFDNWNDRGYSFLESNIFYFQDEPEEMYYVTYIGNQKMLADPTKIKIGIRAINNGGNRWLLEEDLSQDEKNRIIKRFDSEIISKLEHYSRVRVID